MEEGQLNATGVKNLSALQSLTTHQVLPFDFSFFNVDFPMDVSVLVAAEAKPLINVDCIVKLRPDPQQASSPPLQQDGEVLDLCRTLLGMARAMHVELGDEACDLAQNHYVTARQVPLLPFSGPAPTPAAA